MKVYRGLSVLLSFLLLLSVELGFAYQAQAATPTPLAGLEFDGIITIPTWDLVQSPLSHQASIDVFSFDPATHTMYFADRTNKGVSVIDTKTNTYIGTIVVPGCNGLSATGGGSCPSGVQVVPDLHKLVVTDRAKKIFIYDLRVPGLLTTLDLSLLQAPFTPVSGTDELDYDPLNHRVYVANTNAPYFLTIVDAVHNTVVDQIHLPSNPEQPRFNPVDGFLYQNITDEDHDGAASEVLRIDTTKAGNGGTAPIVATFPVPNCEPHGIDIDPVTNTGILGCSGSNPQALMDFGTGKILATFPHVTGTDTEYFNSNVRRWYTASSNNTNDGVQCPQDTTHAFPVVGVFAAPTHHHQIATIVGADCTGRNSHGLGIDPFTNNIYVGARQFPADPNSPSTGHPGVLVFHDPADLAQGEVEEARADVDPLQGFHTHATVRFDENSVRAGVDDLPSQATSALLNITTTIGNEVVNCFKKGDDATCVGNLLGSPLLGGVAFLATDGTPVAKGRIVHGEGRERERHEHQED